MRYKYEPIGKIKMELALVVLGDYHNMEPVNIECYDGSLNIPSEDHMII